MNVSPKVVERLRVALGGANLSEGGDLARALAEEGLVTPEERALLGSVEPIVEAMFLMMGADRKVAREELDLIWDTVRALTDREPSGEAIKGLLKAFGNQLADDGWEARIAAVAKALAPYRELSEQTFAVAASVALADEQITVEENSLVDRFAEVLQIDDERACEILSEIKK